MLNFDSLPEGFNDYLVQIKNTKTGEIIQGLLDNEDLSYSTSAEISGSFLAGSAEGFTKGLATAAAGKIAGDLGRSAVESNYKTMASTYKTYESAGETGFSVNMHIFPRTEKYNDILFRMHKLTQPNTENSVFLHSHLYSPTDASKLLTAEDPFKGNLIHVSIGDWFLATGLFCTGANFSFSKYVDEDGKPLFMVYSASFVPYKLLTAAELSSWHRK